MVTVLCNIAENNLSFKYTNESVFVVTMSRNITENYLLCIEAYFLQRWFVIRTLWSLSSMVVAISLDSLRFDDNDYTKSLN